jgi:hypothetical protein
VTSILDRLRESIANADLCGDATCEVCGWRGNVEAAIRDLETLRDEMRATLQRLWAQTTASAVKSWADKIGGSE